MFCMYKDMEGICRSVFPKRGARFDCLNASHFEHVGKIKESSALLLWGDDLLVVRPARSIFYFLDLPAPEEPYCDVCKHEGPIKRTDEQGRTY